MREIGRITIHCEEHGQIAHAPAASQTRWVLHLYRVIGKSTALATRLCARPAEKSESPAHAVVITLEGLGAPRKEQIDVCLAIKQACHAVHRGFHLCGVTNSNYATLADAGVFDGIDRREIHGSIAALLQSLASAAPRRPARRRVALNARGS